MQIPKIDIDDDIAKSAKDKARELYRMMKGFYMKAPMTLTGATLEDFTAKLYTKYEIKSPRLAQNLILAVGPPIGLVHVTSQASETKLSLHGVERLGST